MTDAPALCSLEDEGKALVARLGGRWSGHGGLCRCPAHDDHNPSLSVRVGQRSLLFHCFAGCETVAVLKGLRAAGHPLGTRAAAAAAPAGSDDDRGWRAARRLWREARAIAGTPADRYLARRGLSTGSTELRYHWRTPDGPSPLTRFRPALVAAVRDETGLVAVHRSFLDPDRDRLAAIDDPRRGLGRFGRGAVRLGGVAPCLGLAEGLETALSATALFGLPWRIAVGGGQVEVDFAPFGLLRRSFSASSVSVELRMKSVNVGLPKKAFLWHRSVTLIRRSDETLIDALAAAGAHVYEDA